MPSGQVLRIVATDPGSVKDFQAFCKQTGNELLSHAEANKEFTFFMKAQIGRPERAWRHTAKCRKSSTTSVAISATSTS